MKFRYLILAAMVAFGFTACDVDQTQEGEMPEVDVAVEEGQMPAYDVDWADVEVQTRTEMVEVPKVKVVMETEAVEVPYIDLDWPEDMGETMERTLAVEADVRQEGNLEIEEIYATDDRLIVLSSLSIAEDAPMTNETMRISDQVVINAPDLDIRYYIVGDQPEGGFNQRYVYISDRSEISDLLQDGRAIYTRKNS